MTQSCLDQDCERYFASETGPQLLVEGGCRHGFPVAGCSLGRGGEEGVGAARVVLLLERAKGHSTMAPRTVSVSATMTVVRQKTAEEAGVRRLPTLLEPSKRALGGQLSRGGPAGR